MIEYEIYCAAEGKLDKICMRPKLWLRQMREERR